MTRPAYDPGAVYRFKTTAFPWTESTTVDVNVVTIESVDATDALQAASAAALSSYDPPTKAELDAGLLPLLDITEDHEGTRRLTAAALELVDEISPQEVRDAMLLAPSAGTPAAGSIDADIDELLSLTTELPTDIANLSVDVADVSSAVADLAVDVAAVADAVTSLSADVSTLTGPGETQIPLRFTLPDGTPIADADVWLTQDEAGENVVAGVSQTASDGVVRFLLDEGATYYAWLQKDGVNSIMALEFVAELPE